MLDKTGKGKVGWKTVKGLPDLDGEDVAVFVGTCADRLSFYAGQISEKGITSVVVLFGPDEPSAREEAQTFAETLRRFPISPLPFPRKLAICDLAQGQRICESVRNGLCSVIAFHADESLPMPDGLLSVTDAHDKSFSPDFDDIPTVRENLARIVRSFAAPPTDGMWPVALLTGETGVGKSFAAKRIHEVLRKRKGATVGEFVHLNCGEFGKEDMNAALFGLKGGSFSGISKEDRVGAIARAKNGILFLDEIGTLPLELQPRLLTALDGIYRLHGDVETHKVACRFIFGTNDDLRKAVAEGRFRRDLYNRIDGISITLPPVRDRIGGGRGAAFLNRITESLCAKYGVRLSRLAHDRFTDFARQYSWRGNFRGLRRFFARLRMTVGETDFVSAAVLQGLTEELEASAGMEDAVPATSAEVGVAACHPLLRDRTDLGANEKVLLSFAFACAAKAATPSAAGRRFFEGKSLSNWNKSFVAVLTRFGYVWAANAEGHIVRS